MKTVDVLIVGAGLAGLTAASQLAEHCSLLVLEKEASVGGRLLTGSLAGGRADLGAQFFTVRTAVFQALVDDWLARDVAFEWSRGWTDGSAVAGKPDGYPRYAAQAGMQSLARDLARGVDIQTGSEVIGLTKVEGSWQLVDQMGRKYRCQHLVLTPPVPQSTALLAHSQLALHPDDQTALDTIVYAPCICGLLWVEGEVNLPEPGALQRPTHHFSWLANNQRKGISPAAQLVTVHASASHSRMLWEEPDEIVLVHVQQELQQFLGEGARVREVELKRWPYASLDAVYPEHFLVAQSLPSLIFAGDGFGGPRVEGTVLSGVAVAEEIKQRLEIRE